MTFPLVGGIFGGERKEPLVRHAHVHVKRAVVIAQAGGPDAALVRGAVILREGQAAGGIADQLPMNQITGMQHGNAGNIGEGGGNHVEVLADANHIRIRVIAQKNGIGIPHRPTLPHGRINRFSIPAIFIPINTFYHKKLDFAIGENV